MDFFDYSFFSDYWMDTDCAVTNNCDATDLDFSGSVGPNDLDLFAELWPLGK